MTPTTTTLVARAHPRTGSRPVAGRRALRRGLAATAGLSAVAIAAVPAGTASAERAATSSDAIAAQAQEALTALAEWNADHTPADYVRYVRARDGVADLIAAEMALPAAEVRDDLGAAAIVNQNAVLAALTQLGVPYRSMASKPGVGFDCSGLTSFAYAVAGISVPRSSGDQDRAAATVAREVAEVGDLVHYPGHVGMYLGGNIYVHSPEPGRDVEIVVMPDRALDFGDLTPVAEPAAVVPSIPAPAPADLE